MHYTQKTLKTSGQTAHLVLVVLWRSAGHEFNLYITEPPLMTLYGHEFNESYSWLTYKASKLRKMKYCQ